MTKSIEELKKDITKQKLLIDETKNSLQKNILELRRRCKHKHIAYYSDRILNSVLSNIEIICLSCGFEDMKRKVTYPKKQREVVFTELPFRYNEFDLILLVRQLIKKKILLSEQEIKKIEKRKWKWLESVLGEDLKKFKKRGLCC